MLPKELLTLCRTGPGCRRHVSRFDFAVAARLWLNFKMTTTTVPIVTIVIDPIAVRIYGEHRNITGVTVAGGSELIGKRLGCWPSRCQIVHRRLHSIATIPGRSKREQRTAFDPDVWPGRASHVDFSELAVSGPASMYPAFDWSVSCS